MTQPRLWERTPLSRREDAEGTAGTQLHHSMRLHPDAQRGGRDAGGAGFQRLGAGEQTAPQGKGRGWGRGTSGASGGGARGRWSRGGWEGPRVSSEWASVRGSMERGWVLQAPLRVVLWPCPFVVSWLTCRHKLWLQTEL